MTGTGRRRDALFNENPDATDWVKNAEGGLTDSDWIASLTFRSLLGCCAIATAATLTRLLEVHRK
jgi:hypothetical protein